MSHPTWQLPLPMFGQRVFPARRACRALPVVALATLAGVAGAAADAPDSRSAIHLRRIGTGDVEGLKKGIALSVEACRTIKHLPLGGAVKMPSDTTLAKLAIVESDEYFDGANHATYNTARMVWADPRSSSCELKLFHERHAWAGQECGIGTSGGTTSLTELTDADHPEPPNVQVSTQPAPRAGCGRKARPYDVEGLAAEDAGVGARCVWQADIIAKSMRAAGLTATGHEKDGPAIDFCLYQRQPIYVFNGHHETVVLKSSGGKSEDVMNQLMGMDSAYLNHKLVEFSDGTPIAVERFSADTVRRFLDQPAITSVGDSR